jgi:hypothetical protein
VCGNCYAQLESAGRERVDDLQLALSDMSELYTRERRALVALQTAVHESATAEIEEQAAGRIKELGLAHVTHDDCWKLCHLLPGDYTPWGQVDRDSGEYDHLPYADCSGGCQYFLPLDDALGLGDWGVCANPKSHRRGLLTFEHQGCHKCDVGPDEDDE